MFELSEGSPAYNRDGAESRTASDVLQLFSHHDWSDFCLAHLFTFEKFSDNRVGVAYEASPFTSQLGGICAPSERPTHLCVCLYVWICGVFVCVCMCGFICSVCLFVYVCACV